MRANSIFSYCHAADDVGTFTENDCYIVLHTADFFSETKQSKECLVYFWVGKTSSLDKRASVAINALHLRSHVRSKRPSLREQQGEESDEFRLLFPGDINIVEGGTECGACTLYIEHMLVAVPVPTPT